ncbi:Uncharacterized protein APZ42_030645 [Daphnia magna]|uniref:Uncharacterized protein n=1 Tax=Daphnia magna TaxID=35525 RepID=A0A164NNW0_9CRUS|nr:Uncharacterized protein APZ42_030645 [Daphnia magna]
MILPESWKPGWFTTCGKSSVVVSNIENSSQSLQRVCDECTNQETFLKTWLWSFFAVGL